MVFATETDWWIVRDALPLLVAAGGLVSFAIAIWQYGRAQQWKRLEFVAQEMKQFETDSSVKKVLIMLDWKKRKMDLFPNDSDTTKRVVSVTHEMITSALEFHEDREPCVYLPHEVAIRSLFDELLTYFNRFGHYVEVGVLQGDDILPYLRYWLDILTNPHSTLMGEACRQAIQRYVVKYSNIGAELLLNTYCKSENYPALKREMPHAGAAPISVASTIV